MKLEVLPDEQGLATRAAELTRDLAKEKIEEKGTFSIALAGGSIAKAYHRALAEMKDLAWDRIVVFHSDERAVPPDHAESNHGMARATLLDHVPIPKENVHRVRADDGDHVRAAEEYERELIATVGPSTCDLVMLGMGPDGHTASLFPGAPEPEPNRLVIATIAPPTSPIEKRISFSYLALERAPAVMVLVNGAGKAERLAEVLGDRPVDLPMRRVLDRRSLPTFLLVDEAAASRLEEK